MVSKGGVNKRRSADVGLPHNWIQGPMCLATNPATDFKGVVNNIIQPCKSNEQCMFNCFI